MLSACGKRRRQGFHWRHQKKVAKERYIDLHLVSACVWIYSFTPIWPSTARGHARTDVDDAIYNPIRQNACLTSLCKARGNRSRFVSCQNFVFRDYSPVDFRILEVYVWFLWEFLGGKSGRPIDPSTLNEWGGGGRIIEWMMSCGREFFACCNFKLDV